MLARLSANLLQVLLLWVVQVQQSDPDAHRACRSDIIRFVMFWRLCILNEDKASGRCFEAIRKESGAVISMKVLYHLLVNDPEAIAVGLASTSLMRAFLVRSNGSHLWLSRAARFNPKEDGPVELAKRWWDSGEASLLWLQRAYLERSFPEFDPASGRDDDTPYDLDHMNPRSDWGEDWRPFSKKLRATGLFGSDGEPEGIDLREMGWNRSVIGEAVGNKWLVDFSTNRAWGDAPFSKKIEKLRNEADRQSESDLSYRDMAFDSAAIQTWLSASGTDRKWSSDRLVLFQQAVEERTAWLYEQFYTDLKFDGWQGGPSVVPPVSPFEETSLLEVDGSKNPRG